MSTAAADLPYVEADGVDDCRLDDLLPREHAPSDGDGLGGVTVRGILGTDLVDNVIVDPLVARQHLKEGGGELWTGKKLKISLQ